MKNIYWYDTDTQDLYYGYIAGFRVEKQVTSKGCKYCVGKMKEALIIFDNIELLYKFLTV